MTDNGRVRERAAPYGIGIIGYGEQARRFYHPMLERLASRHPLRLRLVVDLADRAEAIRGFLAHHRLQPERLVLLDPVHRYGERLAPEAESALDDLLAAGQLDRLLVIAEPKAHKPYVLWGTRNGVDVLCEKPLTAVTALATQGESRAWRLYADYLEIAESMRDGRVVLMSPRRLHEGYETVMRYLRDFMVRFEVPITYIDNYHAEGVWNMPDEFGTRENHPYRYGYGKLLHSGYHHVDLATRVALLNTELAGKAPDHVELCAQATRPLDFFAQVDADRYRALLHADRFGPILASPMPAAAHLGETDVHVMGQFLRSGRALTNVQLSLMHTSVNTRSWHTLPTDLRRNGRLPHERMTVHIGHLLTIEVNSRYSAPGEPDDEPRNPFRIHAFRNAGVVGGEPFEEIHVGDGNAAHLAESARVEILRRWLTGEPLDAELSSHGDSVRILSAIYASLARRREGRDGLVRVALRPDAGNRKVFDREARQDAGRIR